MVLLISMGEIMVIDIAEINLKKRSINNPMQKEGLNIEKREGVSMGLNPISLKTREKA